MKLKYTAFLIVCLTQISIAELFTPGSYLSGSANDYTIWGWTEPNENGLGAAIWVETDPNNFLLTMNSDIGGTVGIGHSWYAVAESTAIDADFASNTTPFYSIYDSGNFSQSIDMSSQPFMLAFWLDANGTDVPDTNDTFGWAKFTYDGSTLNLIDSAAENDGVGIYAGQYQQVPEPSSVLLLTMGAGGILFYRRAKRHQQEQRTNRRSFQ